MPRDGDTTEALLAQDLLHSLGPARGRIDASRNHVGGWMLLGHRWLRMVVQQDPWGTRSSPACKTLHGAWLLATRGTFPPSIIWKDLGMAWLKFLGNEVPVLQGASFGLTVKRTASTGLQCHLQQHGGSFQWATLNTRGGSVDLRSLLGLLQEDYAEAHQLRRWIWLKGGRG